MTVKESPIMASRRKHLFRIWNEIVKQDSLPQIDKWLSDEFRRNSRFGSNDRKWYSEVLFSGIRFALFAWWCEKNQIKKFLTSSPNSLPRALENSEFEAPFSFTKYCREISFEDFFYYIELRYGYLKPSNEYLGIFTISKQERLAFEGLIAKIISRADLRWSFIWESIPLRFYEYFEERIKASGWDLSTQKIFIEKQNARPPLWLRINHLDKTSECIAALGKENFAIEQKNSALKVNGLTGIYVSKAYQNGLVEIQDYGSQLAGNMVDAQPGQLVWDACSGGGGKTLQIASKLQNKGAVYASDIREYKLEEVKKRARRAGFFNIRCVPWDGITHPDFPREVKKKGGFDWVLIDAPCSSAGTWRRNPDAKYRIDAKEIEKITAIQSQILASAARALLENGHLVYSTCSWLVEENENIINAFLTANPNFELVSKDLLGHPFVDSDTLFAAKFKKVRK